MTATDCEFWQGEGCIIEIMTGIKCKGMTKDFVPQCKLKNTDLIETEGDL